MTLDMRPYTFYRTRKGERVTTLGRGHEHWNVKRLVSGELYIVWPDGRRVAGEDGPDDLVAEWTDEPETQPETGTLAELNVKPGDVVQIVRGFSGFENYAVKHRCRNFIVNAEGGADSECENYNFSANCHHIFRIVSRASQPDTPKLWRDMTPEEKGALLLAHHEGKVIENREEGNEKWIAALPFWADTFAYRIRPEPKRETVSIYCDDTESKGNIRRIGTIELIDGKPDRASICMEEL